MRSAPRTAGKTDDNFYSEDFGKEHGLAGRIDVFLRVLGIGMNGVAMTTESRNANPAVFKLFQPGSRFSVVIDEVVEGPVVVVWIAAGADLHCFQTDCV